MATLNIQPVEDLDHPDLKPYRTLRRRKDLERENIFVAEGDKVVRRLLESPFPVASLLVSREWLAKLDGLLASRPDTIQVFVATKEQTEQITGFGCYQHIKAVGRIDQPVTLEQILRGSPRPRLFAAVDGLNNAENLGVVVRNAAALGVQALIVGETSCSPFLTRAIRVSMGTIFRLPAVEVANLLAAMAALREAGVRSIAAHPHTDQRRLSQAGLAGDACIVLGNEGYGIRPDVLAACDERAVIPMHSEVDSLNVGSASAAFFYEAARQRGRA